MGSRKGLGELLVRESLIGIEQLEEARKEQKQSGGRLTTALIKKGFVKEKDLADFMGKQYGLPTIDLDSFGIDSEAVQLLNAQICAKYNVIPVQKSGRSLVVAFSDPSNVFIKDDLALLTRMKIEIVVASERAIARAIEQHFGSTTESQDLREIMSEMADDESFTSSKDDAVIIGDGGDVVGDEPIINFVNGMLAEAIKQKASDIHIESYESRFRIRFRVDGVLQDKGQPPQGAAAAITNRIKIISKMDIAERRKPQDGRLKVRVKQGMDIDFRVNSVPTLFGEKIVLRLLDKSNLQTDMLALGLDEGQLKIFQEALGLPQGMILITGPTGSGKTTTVYSALAELNQPFRNITTAEDPVEFNLDGINQVQVNSDIGFNFPEALRAFLRQDPEIIMVGEIRDLETAQIAYKAASTGHLVVSTLHTNDATSTVTRLLAMGVPNFMVAESTSLVVAQRLIKRICENCKVPTSVPDETLLQVGVLEEELPQYKKLYRGEGCAECNMTGLRGRMAIFEVLKVSSVVKDSIFKGASPLEMKRRAVLEDNMQTLRRSALHKMRDGFTTVQEVINTTIEDDL